MDINIDPEQVADEARKNFSLRDRLAKVSRRTKTVTVYTDDDAGETLGGVEDEMIGEYATGRKLRTGLIGELDALKERITRELALLDEDAEDYAEQANRLNATLAEESAALVEKIGEIRKQLEATSLTFNLQALPDIIVRDVRRKTRAALELTEKGIPESRQEEYDLEYAAQMLVASTSSWTDNATGETVTSLSADDAHALQDFLPRGQFLRLERAMVELSLEVKISNHATDSADF